MSNWTDRLTDRVLKDWHVIEQAKLVFGTAAILVMSISAFITWQIASALHAERFATQDALIKYLQSQIDNKQVGAPSSTVVARMVVTAFEVLPFDASDHFKFNVRLKNNGPLTAVGAIFSRKAKVTDRMLTDAEEDEQIATTLASPRRLTSTETYTDQEIYFTEEYADVSKSVAEQILRGEKYFYYFLLIFYRDSALPPSKMRLTETCHFIWTGLGFRRCERHNRVIVTD